MYKFTDRPAWANCLRALQLGIAALSVAHVAACAAAAPESLGSSPRPSAAPPQHAGERADGQNRQDPAPQWLQLSTDDSTSMASPQRFKAGQQWGLLAHEFLNYYDPPRSLVAQETWPIEVDITEDVRFALKGHATSAAVPCALAEPRADDAESVAGECAGEVQKDVVDLLFHMNADFVRPLARRNWNLTLCVDVSGSMSGDNLNFTRAALNRVLNHVKSGDRVSLVAFNDESRVLLENVDAMDHARLRDAFDALEADGGTNMLAGLEDAYAVTARTFDVAKTNRVIVFGDGNANIGDTDLQTFAAQTRRGDQEGIYLSGVGVGYNYDAARMDALTDAGKGAHVFLPNLEEVDRIFGNYLYKLVEVAADDIAIELEVPAALRLMQFSGEEVSVDPNQRLQNIILATGDDMTFTARFIVDDAAALDAAMQLKVTARPLSTENTVIRTVDLAAVRDLFAEPGALFARTALIDAFGRLAARDPAAPLSKAEVQAALDAADGSDWGMAELRAHVDDLPAREAR